MIVICFVCVFAILKKRDLGGVHVAIAKQKIVTPQRLERKKLRHDVKC